MYAIICLLTDEGGAGLLTARERELLAWIEENPMISQLELADRAGIARSSISVHISNLMKKGYIAGKGYVVKKAPYVAVIGGANMDVTGRVDTPLAFEDSTPGKVEVAFGGVGRNQAHNLRLLDVDVKFITAFGDDFYGEQMRQNCRELSIDITDSLVIPNVRTSTYVSIIDQHHNLHAGVSDMDVYAHLTPQVLEARSPVINKAAVCAVDTNIPRQSIAYLAANVTPPLFVETVSKAKVECAGQILKKIHTLRTDQSEVAHLLGYALDHDAAQRKAVLQLLAGGVQNIYIHLPDENKVLCANKDCYFKLAYHSHETIHKNGARDSFMAALIWAHIQGLDFEQAARAGAAAASLCEGHSQDVNHALQPSLLYKAAGVEDEKVINIEGVDDQ